MYSKALSFSFYLLLIITAVTSSQNGMAQSLEEFRQLYPTEKVVFTNFVREYYFTKKGSELQLSSKTKQNMLFMYDDANAYADQTVYQSAFSQVSDLEAVTTVRGKSYKVQTFKTKTNESRNIFFDDSKVIAFSLLNTGENATAEISYQTNYPNPYLLPDIYFISYLPYHNVEATFYVDKDIDFRFFEFNLKEYGITFTKTEKRNQNIYKWVGKRVKPLHSDNFQFNGASTDMYFPHVITYIASYQKDGRTVNLQRDINDLYRWNYGNLSEGIGTKIELNPEMKIVVDSIKQKSSTQEDLLKNIYEYVQKRIYYVAIEDSLSGFIPRKPTLVFDRKYGDCKDMACLLHTLLQYAGIKSYPTWIGTRDIAYDLEKVPLLSCFNHMITAAELNNKTYFLDPTNNFLTYDMPAYSLQGKKGMLAVDANTHKVLSVPIVPASSNRINDTSFITINGTEIEGNFIHHRTGYPAQAMRYTISNITQKDFQKLAGQTMQRGGSRCQVSDVVVANERDAYKDLIISGKYKVPTYVTTNSDNIYVNMNVQTYLRNSYYTVETTVAPTENDFLYTYTYVMRMKIPEGMKVRYVPEPFGFEDKNFKVSMTYTTTDTEVILVQEFTNKELYWYKDYYATWNEQQKKLAKNYKESVVLTKK